MKYECPKRAFLRTHLIDREDEREDDHTYDGDEEPIKSGFDNDDEDPQVEPKIPIITI